MTKITRNGRNFQVKNRQKVVLYSDQGGKIDAKSDKNHEFQGKMRNVKKVLKKVFFSERGELAVLAENWLINM